MDVLSTFQITVFVIGSAFIVYLSKRSLKNLKHHGFYRFFVFELTLILLLINVPHWFDYPFTIQQIAAWILLLISLILLVQSLYFFKKVGGGKRGDAESVNFQFENTATLIKDGINKYIRHPMYGSLLFLALGASLKDVSLLSVLITITIIIFLVATAKTEEKENIKYFGLQYEDYMKITKMFIPFIF